MVKTNSQYIRVRARSFLKDQRHRFSFPRFANWFFLEMVQISEVKGNIRDRICTDGLGTARENRVAAHSHIRGLGLREDGIADQSAAGFIGQQQAREVL